MQKRSSSSSNGMPVSELTRLNSSLNARKLISKMHHKFAFRYNFIFLNDFIAVYRKNKKEMREKKEIK